jgi:hypothetical protein
MRSCSTRSLARCLLTGLLLYAANALATADVPATRGEPPAVESAARAAQPSEEAARNERLGAILQTIGSTEAERAEIAKRRKAAPAEAEAKQLDEDLVRVSRRLEELRTAFEELATGGVSAATLEQEAEEKPVDWRQELEDVLRPLLNEIKQLTERPRTIERLRTELAVYQDRLQTADRALMRLDEALGQADSASLKKALTELKQSWTSRRADAESRLQLVGGQLERLLSPDSEDSREILAALREFLGGRGLNALLAVAGFFITYALLAYAGNLVVRTFLQRREAQTRRLAKAGGILFRTFSFLAALVAAMAVLYVRGDWLILGLLILMLLGLALSLRNTLPRYVDHLRILLNLGGVREGERVVYRGIPWRVKSLNIYSTLHNPLLSGGTVRVPIDEMAKLQSRQYVAEEPWFPSRENDFVILDGDVFGKVLLQTPDIVQVQVIGATQTFAATDYLGRHPRNLSLEGFAVPVSFGLDYRHQADILTDIVSRLREHLRDRFGVQVFNPFLKDLIVDFNEAASSSLNLIIVAVFEGAAAEHYWSIRRFLQQTAVDACNRFGWTIPFDQLTVQLRDDKDALRPA